jgi:hypothetical protein
VAGREPHRTHTTSQTTTRSTYPPLSTLDLPNPQHHSPLSPHLIPTKKPRPPRPQTTKAPSAIEPSAGQNKTHISEKYITLPTLSLPSPPPDALTQRQHPTPSTHLPTEMECHESTPEHQYRLQKRIAPPRNQIDHDTSSAISNNMPPKLGNIHVRTSLGVQALLTDNTIKSIIPSSPLEATRDPLSLKSRRSSPPIHKAKAARPGTAWRADCDRQSRLTTHTKRYNATLDDQDPGPSSVITRGKGQSPAEVIATPRHGQNAEISQSKLEE